MGYFEDIRAVVRGLPPGKVATYGEVARAAGYPGSGRQVAWALRHASARGIPWQRIVGAGGTTRLPGESGMEQRLLLEMEGVKFAGGRIRMKQFEYRFPKTRAKGGRRAPGRPGSAHTVTGRLRR